MKISFKINESDLIMLISLLTGKPFYYNFYTDNRDGFKGTRIEIFGENDISVCTLFYEIGKLKISLTNIE